MDQFVKTAQAMDRPEVLERLFFPRREGPEEARPETACPMLSRWPRTFPSAAVLPLHKERPLPPLFPRQREIAADTTM